MDEIEKRIRDLDEQRLRHPAIDRESLLALNRRLKEGYGCIAVDDESKIIADPVAAAERICETQFPRVSKTALAGCTGTLKLPPEAVSTSESGVPTREPSKLPSKLCPLKVVPVVAM